MKTFTEEQFLDPWRWCVGVIEDNSLDPKLVAEMIGAPPSTVRALLNGQNSAPRYDTLRSLLKLCVDIKYRGADEVFGIEFEEVAPEQPSIEDFL